MPEKKKFLLRLDPLLYQSLEKWAADELRSANAHIEYLLLQAARRAGRVPDSAKAEPQQPPDGQADAGGWGV